MNNSLQKDYPDLYSQLVDIKNIIEAHIKDVVDLEFTVENGKVYVLNYRIARRTPKANLIFALDFFKEGRINLWEALSRISEKDVIALLRPTIPNKNKLRLLSNGLPAVYGAACGILALNSNYISELIEEKLPFIFCAVEITPLHFDLLKKSNGLVISRGGYTSHGALIARQIGIPCVCGASNLNINHNSISTNDITIKQGEFITIDGSNGQIYQGKTNLINKKWNEIHELKELSLMIEYAINYKYYDNTVVSKLWLIRDFFHHNIIPTFISSPKKFVKAPNQYISFTQPNRKSIVGTMKRIENVLNNSNMKYVLKGFRQTLFRLLSTKVGIGSHYKYYRPLVDPLKSYISEDEYFCQLIKEEFFNINKYIPNLIDIASIRLEFVIISHIKDELWKLDYTNKRGESIIDGAYEVRNFRIFVNNIKIKNTEIFDFYHLFRRREEFYEFYTSNNTTHKKILEFLQSSYSERIKQKKMNSICHELGLLNKNKLSDISKNLVIKEDKNER